MSPSHVAILRMPPVAVSNLRKGRVAPVDFRGLDPYLFSLHLHFCSSGLRLFIKGEEVS